MVLDDEMRSELEQAQAVLTETLPPLLWGMYEALKKQGFTESQAMDLVNTYLHGMNSGSK